MISAWPCGNCHFWPFVNSGSLDLLPGLAADFVVCGKDFIVKPKRVSETLADGKYFNAPPKRVRAIEPGLDKTRRGSLRRTSLFLRPLREGRSTLARGDWW